MYTFNVWMSLFSCVYYEDVVVDMDGDIIAMCRSCKEYTPLYCSPYIWDDEFDPDMHYCGGSPRCCP